MKVIATMRHRPLTLRRLSTLAPALAGLSVLALLAAAHTRAQPQAKAKPDTKPDTKAAPAVASAPAPAATPAAPAPLDQAEVAREVARKAEVLAHFEAGQITVGDLEEQVNAQSVFMRKRYAEPGALQALLDKSVRFELLAAEAVRRGYDKNDAVVFSVKQNAVQAMIKQEFDEKLTPESIPAQDVQKYYDEHLEEFVQPELRRASQVRVASELGAKALLAEAKTADLRAFRELSRTRSMDEATKLRGGDLGYFDLKGKVSDENMVIDAALAKAAFALSNVGDTSEPIKVGDAYSIVKLTGQRAAHEEKLKDADERIRMRLWRERRQAGIDGMVATLKAQLKPEVHPELVDAIVFDTVAPLPPPEGLPAGFPQGKPLPAPTPKTDKP